MSAWRVYIAGPIAGHPDHAQGFARAADRIRAAGDTPVNPLDVAPTQHDGPCPEYGYHPGESEQWESPHVSSCCFMRSDIEALLSCDAIYLLPGWESSRGACVEVAVARAVGIPQLTAAGFTEAPNPPVIDVRHIESQRAWSASTFGPSDVRGPLGPLDHIRKELAEIEAAPTDVEEWADVIILALDGAWRGGADPLTILHAVVDKQAKNRRRSWPDWRGSDPTKAIEHDRTGEVTS